MPTAPPWRSDIAKRLIVIASTTSLSSRQIARELSSEFGFEISRNAVIGKLARSKGVERPKKIKPPKPKRKPKKMVTVKKPPVPPPKPVTLPEEIKPGDFTRWSSPLSSGKVTIMELTNTTCRWPMAGFLDVPPYDYCGDLPTDKGTGKYCAAHARLAYIPSEDRRRGVRPVRR